jgi:hypothetical protein
MKITPENKKYLNSDYVARKDNELPVLERWFEIADMPEGAISPHFKATYLDVILYSKSQIEKENEAMSNQDKDQNWGMEYDYGIIWIKP